MTVQEKAKSLVEEIKFNCSWGAGDSEQFGIENAVKILTESVIPEIMMALTEVVNEESVLEMRLNYWESVRTELTKMI